MMVFYSCEYLSQIYSRILTNKIFVNIREKISDYISDLYFTNNG